MTSIDRELIQITHQGDVAILVLNDPDALNALSPAMIEALNEALLHGYAPWYLRVLVAAFARGRGFPAPLPAFLCRIFVRCKPRQGVMALWKVAPMMGASSES